MPLPSYLEMTRKKSIATLGEMYTPPTYRYSTQKWLTQLVNNRQYKQIVSPALPIESLIGKTNNALLVRPSSKLHCGFSC